MPMWENAPANSEAAFEVLKECAKYMRTISYEDLGSEIGRKHGDAGPAPVSLRFPLGFIRDEICRRKGLPWLNALAVGKSSSVPGESFIPPGAGGPEVNDPAAELLWWRGMVLQVYAYPWETLALK